MRRTGSRGVSVVVGNAGKKKRKQGKQLLLVLPR